MSIYGYIEKQKKDFYIYIYKQKDFIYIYIEDLEDLDFQTVVGRLVTDVSALESAVLFSHGFIKRVKA
jgi:hypothetical protein